MSTDTEFREETRSWLEENCPAPMRTPMPDNERVWGGRNAEYPNPDSKVWLDRMVAKGWTVPTWPEKYGGGGLDKHQARILDEEMQRLKCRPPLASFGIWMLGPVLLELASESQRLEYLPPIARGEIRWCQGYSEPGAGSDLAALQTRADDRGDHYLVNGQKIWTSYANYADWIFCLVRTDTTLKHGGISFLLFDMTSPGVETRPIKLISGTSVFCETFFTDVEVPKGNLVGEVNGGWQIAKALLGHERKAISQLGVRATGNLSSTMELVRHYLDQPEGELKNREIRAELASMLMDDEAFALTSRRTATSKNAGALASMLKYFGTEQNKRKFELLIKCAGSDGLGWEGEEFSKTDLDLCRQWLRSKGNSIEGGTSEVQLNVIAKRVLGLPD
ncbi:MAG: acyl-CoA dehydrogenase family protein [Pseudomonadota bacterium]